MTGPGRALEAGGGRPAGGIRSAARMQAAVIHGAGGLARPAAAAVLSAPAVRARLVHLLVVASLVSLALILAALAAAPASAQEGTSLPTYISTPQGWKHTENDYIPGVTQSELGWFAGQTSRGQRVECLKAQSIAARTFVLRWLNANGHGRTIPALGPTFQAYSSRPSSHTRSAALAVRGQVMTHQGRVIYANYVAGAWPLDGNGRALAPSRYGFPASYTWTYIRDQYVARQRGSISSSTWSQRVTRYSSWAWTEILWTDNEGKSGSAITQTVHASRTERNRGGLGQYRAYWLDRERGYGYVAILRAFYGADVTVVGAAGGSSSGSSSGGGSGTGGGSSTPSTGGGSSSAPDLTVTSVRPVNRSGSDLALAVGHSIGFTATVRNLGSALSGTQAITVSFRVNGQEVGRGQRALALRAGEEVEVALGQGGFSPGNPGTVTIEAVVDPAGQVAERSESNNAIRTTRAVFAALQVTANVLNVRSGPSTGSGLVGAIRSGQRYAARERQGDWYRIDLEGGVSGWSHGGYLQRTNGASAVLIDTPALNVRSGPSAGTQRLGGTTVGQVYVQTSAQSGWHRIFWDGREGWVSGSYVKPIRL